MTLYSIIEQLKSVAMQQPTINMIVENDIYKLNGIPDAQYGVFAFTQDTHSVGEGNNFITYNFTLFYVDRLLADKSNQIEIQSVGIQTLSNILRVIDDNGMMVGAKTFQPFLQKFTDECAGVFVKTSITTTIDYICAESFK